MPGYCLTTASKPLARPCAPVWPSAPWVMMILPLPPSLVTSACVTDAPMNSLSGARKAVDVDLVERRDQRVHVDDRDAGIDHLLHRLGQRADAERLDRDEVPFLRGHVVDRGALLDGVELAVEPGHLDVEELAPVFRRRLALGAPGRLQAGIGERRLQRLLRAAGRRRRQPSPGRCRGRRERAAAPPTEATVRKSRLPVPVVSVIASSSINRTNAGADRSLAA